MPFLHFREPIITRNYEVLGNGFNLQPSPNAIEEAKSFRWNIELAKDITALFSSIILTAIAYGILVALIAFKVNENIKNEILISISSATQIGAGVLFGRFLPILGRKMGMINSIYLASLVSAVSALALYFYVDYFLWISVIFFFGASLFIGGVTRQTIMIGLAPPHTKALMISMGGMLVAIGNGFGPILLEIIKTDNSFWSYLIVALLYLLSMLPLSRLKKTEDKVREEKNIGIWRYLQASPKIMMAGFCVNYSMSAANAFLIIYGLKIGLSESEASLLYSVLLFGTVFSIPLGYLTDVVNRRLLMIASAALSLICVIAIYNAGSPEAIRPLLFITFGCLVGMKLPAVVLINEKYKPTQRLAVNAAFAKFSLIGNVIGIFTTGAIMKFFGADGLWISISIILSFYLLFCIANYSKKMFDGNLKFARFSLTNKSKMEQ